MNIRFIQAALVSTMLLGGCVYADRPYDDRPHAAGPDLSASFVFSERERIYLNDYYRRNLPPGLAKQGRVPPGHARRLQRGMPWPPAVIYHSLPHHLENDLQPLPRGYARFIVGPDVVIVDLGARLIVDAIHLAF